MYEGAQALLTIITRAGFDAYYIGGKCRCELNNEFHENHIEVKDIDIVTSASVEQLKHIFPSSDDVGKRFQVLLVNFANTVYEVASYRVDRHFDENGVRLPEVATTRALTLDEDRQRRDFTINAIAQDVDGRYLDFEFERAGRKFSAIADVKAKVIRAIGEPKDRFNEDPLRILRAFRFMSVMNYTIDRTTLSAMRTSMKLLRTIPIERVGAELRKIIVGRNAPTTLKLMHKLGVFKLKCSGGKVPVLPLFEAFEDVDFDILDHFTRAARDELEVWALLFVNHVDAIADNLVQGFMSSADVVVVNWLAVNVDLPSIVDDNIKARRALRRAVVVDQQVARHDVHYLKGLVLKLMHLHRVFHENTPESKTAAKQLFFNFCARPYFTSQLDVSGYDMMAWTSEPRGPWISKVKQSLIDHLVSVEQYPTPDEIRTLLVPTMIARNGITVDGDGVVVSNLE